MALRRDARAAAQGHLSAHELAVVLTNRAGRGTEAWVGEIRAGGPLPRFVIDLPEWHCARRVFPLEFGGQARAAPTRERVGFVVAYVYDGLVGIERSPTRERECRP